jgi:hypothetical protein
MSERKEGEGDKHERCRELGEMPCFLNEERKGSRGVYDGIDIREG